MADWKKNRQKFQMPHDRVERCMRYVTAVEKNEKRAEKARKARFDALLLERWQARHPIAWSKPARVTVGRITS